ncbi:sugar transferase [Phascolarctobacterium succinatutens]
MIYAFAKRIFDIVSSLLAICAFAIPWIVIAVTIKLQSPGPVIYKARRVGKNGKAFTLYKFRSMRVDSGAIHATTLRGDPRIFPFGVFLRKSKLDETPQLFNILKGEMSVIGPRPEDEENSGKFYVGKYREILSVKPGLSSPASLYDYTHGEKYESEDDYVREFLPKKLDVELYYVKNRSFVYDIQIIYNTIITITQIVLGKEDFVEPKELGLCRKV